MMEALRKARYEMPIELMSCGSGYGRPSSNDE
jgi:hypothetical protein